MTARHFTAGYMGDPFDIDAHVQAARHCLRDVDYDTMVGTGLSGALVVPGLARELGKYALIVRKPRDGSHTSLPAEGYLGDRWVFVDDFVSTGATRDRVLEVLASLCTGAEFVGTFSYARGTNGDGPRFDPAEPEPMFEAVAAAEYVVATDELIAMMTPALKAHFGYLPKSSSEQNWTES